MSFVTNKRGQRRKRSTDNQRVSARNYVRRAVRRQPAQHQIKPRASPKPGRDIALSPSDEQYRLLFEAHPHPLWVFDSQSLAVLAVNEAAVRQYGYSRQEFLATTIKDICPITGPSRGLTQPSQMDSESREGEECVHRRKDGSLINVAVTHHGIIFEGRPARLLLALDITRRKQTEEALRESELRKAAILEAALDCIITIDHQGCVVDFNSAAEKIFGYQRNEIMGREMAELIVPPRLRDRHRRGLAQFLATAEGRVVGKRIEMPALRKDGSEFPAELSIHPIRSAGRTWFTGYLRDISDRKQAEEALLAIVQGVSAKIGDEFFAVLVQHLARSLHVDYVLVGQLVEGSQEKIRTNAIYTRGRIGENIEYALAHTPCENVVGKQLCSYVRGVRQLFPLDPLLREMEAESYLGAPLFDSAGRALGLMAVLDREPLANPSLAASMLQAFAARAAAELERQMSQEALQRSEERFRIVARATDDVIWDWDLKTNHVWWSENCEAMLGYQQKELEGGADSWSSRLHPQDSQWVLKGVHAAIEAGDRYWAGEYRFRRRDGSYAYLLDRGYILHDGQGRPVRMIGALMDMTERERAQKELQESEERFRRIVETSFEGICVVDAHAGITFANWRMAAMLGQPLEELLGQTIFDFVDEPNRDEARKRFKRRGEGISEQFDLCFRRNDGAKLWVIMNASPIFDSDGTFQGALGMITDITERKNAEASLRQLTGRLLQLQDEERRRIARELHDNTAQNLAALAMSLSSLKMAAPQLNPKAEKALLESLSYAEQCSQEVRTISYLLHPPLLDELGLVRALRDYVEGFSRRSDIAIDLVLPTTTERLPVEVETALFRIVQESLGNIHRHSGSRTAAIRLQLTPKEARLEVQDSGHGMLSPEPDAGAAPAAGLPALGVGIAGMRERMQQLGGRLEIHSHSEGTLIRAIAPVSREAS